MMGNNYHVINLTRGYGVRHVVSGYITERCRSLAEAERICKLLNHK